MRRVTAATPLAGADDRRADVLVDAVRLGDLDGAVEPSSDAEPPLFAGLWSRQLPLGPDHRGWMLPNALLHGSARGSKRLR
jgi:hypothetical protein